MAQPAGRITTPRYHCNLRRQRNIGPYVYGAWSGLQTTTKSFDDAAEFCVLLQSVFCQAARCVTRRSTNKSQAGGSSGRLGQPTVSMSALRAPLRSCGTPWPTEKIHAKRRVPGAAGSFSAPIKCAHLWSSSTTRSIYMRSLPRWVLQLARRRIYSHSRSPRNRVPFLPLMFWLHARELPHGGAGGGGAGGGVGKMITYATTHRVATFLVRRKMRRILADPNVFSVAVFLLPFHNTSTAPINSSSSQADRLARSDVLQHIQPCSAGVR